MLSNWYLSNRATLSIWKAWLEFQWFSQFGRYSNQQEGNTKTIFGKNYFIYLFFIYKTAHLNRRKYVSNFHLSYCFSVMLIPNSPAMMEPAFQLMSDVMKYAIVGMVVMKLDVRLLSSTKPLTENNMLH